MADQTFNIPENTEEMNTKKLSSLLACQVRKLRDAEKSLIIVLEGYDASGKSGCAERIVRFMDKEDFKIIHTAAPTEEELSYCYLMRFWRDIPAFGKVAVFDRSWYGRVLVERVDGLCLESEWKRAYGEILNFERYLIANGAVLLKFWLDVSEEEQLRRFRRRAENPAKRHKITGDDWLNRSKRKLYDDALYDMLKYTDCADSRWRVIPANDKKAARAAVLKNITDAVSEALPENAQCPNLQGAL